MKVYATFPENYELIDAGGGKKLERWGSVITIRPEHQAYFAASLPSKKWKELADWEFLPVSEGALNGTWKALKSAAPKTWTYHYQSLQFQLEITQNKHIGLFPEQQYNWEFLARQLNAGKRFLNAFAYTGASSLVGRLTGAEVIHCDSMRGMLDWGRMNMESSHLEGIKWVLEDALKFIKREHKRGNHYDIVQMDPPAWGIGAKGEKWKLEQLLPELIQEALALIAPKGTLILNTYSPKITREKLQEITQPYARLFTITHAELWMETSHGKKLYYGIVSHLTRI
jgi:23S rRNA (cytosine1962-C5)-methyltransferase